MVTLTIDGRAVTVDAGTTVLSAARRLGIDVPTLCHVPGLEPASSCFVCAVQIEGRRNLSPACALPVADGMVVTTNSADIRRARQMALELLLSDHAGDCVAPCAGTCPAGLDIPRFVMDLAKHDTGGAIRVIAETLALPGSLGRVCPRLCEQECRRRDYDVSLAIGALHRYAADRERYVPERERATAKRVAVIGAGPAGLAAAYFLLRRGHMCTLYDSKPEAGGMLRYGIPAHRLPKDALAAEVGIIRELGAEFRFEQRWGADFTLQQLRQANDAVFIATGAPHAQDLRCEGEEHALSGIEFLELVNTGNPPVLGGEVVVIGGGNTAVDCARAAVRVGARSVRMLYRRTQREMPCLLSEAEEAQREGVGIEFLVAPVRVERNGHHLLSLTCQRIELGEADKDGRRRPVPVKGSEFSITCSTVIAAIGQTVDRGLAERQGLRVDAIGIAADERTFATNLPGVFAGGDAVLGADLAVRAVATGRMAAASIHQYLTGVRVVGEPTSMRINMKPMDDLERAAIFRDIERTERVRHPEIEWERRVRTFDEVELGLPPEQAETEAHRCMSCGCGASHDCRIRRLATEYRADPYRYPGARRRFTQDTSHPEIVYEPGKCIVCNACVRIAAEAGEPVGLTIAGRGFDVAVAAPFGKTVAEGLRRAGRKAAEVCPTGALAFRGQRSCDLVKLV
ncbi:MAG: FAD-dependent oxidoreductase [Bryobacterales bacterium]|nr:FAD-dependent oxidoreductase [Bryobacterales bacterium]